MSRIPYTVREVSVDKFRREADKMNRAWIFEGEGHFRQSALVHRDQMFDVLFSKDPNLDLPAMVQPDKPIPRIILG